MKPYKNLNSKNLGLLLLSARITAFLGAILFVFSLLFCVFLAFTSGIFSAVTSFAFVSLSVGVLFLSGLMAAVVAFEENFRLRTQYLISGSET